jgi:hypothetical protein
MKLKSELYKKEQEEIIDKIKQDKLLELIPDIRKYYSFTSSIGANDNVI